MTRIFRYILKTDNGMAPCSDSGLLSLATCKPKIRASAQPGDWVLGFYPRPAPRGLLAWAAQVERSLPVGDYQREFSERADAVYRLCKNGTYKRLWPEYHPTKKEFLKDISAPVLVFGHDKMWYFGGKPIHLPVCLEHLAAAGRGHRVSGVKDGDPERLIAWLGACVPPGVHAPPRDPPLPKAPTRSC